MQLRHLEYFAAVANFGSFTQAAQALGIAQPSLSKQIRVLENNLGTALFVRARAGVELTSAGEALLPHARRILVDSENAQRAVREVVGLQRGRVRLGATPSFCDGLLPGLIAKFQANYPHIEFEVLEAGSKVLAGQLEQMALDLAFLIMPLRSRDPGLVSQPLLREDLVLIGPASSDLPARMNFPEVAKLPLVMLRSGYDLRDATLATFTRHHLEPKLALTGGELGSVLRFVEEGLGYAIVPEMVLTNRPQLRMTRISEPKLRREIALVHRTDGLQLAAAAFRQEIVGSFATEIEITGQTE